MGKRTNEAGNWLASEEIHAEIQIYQVLELFKGKTDFSLQTIMTRIISTGHAPTKVKHVCMTSAVAAMDVIPLATIFLVCPRIQQSTMVNCNRLSEQEQGFSLHVQA